MLVPSWGYCFFVSGLISCLFLAVLKVLNCCFSSKRLLYVSHGKEMQREEIQSPLYLPVFYTFPIYLTFNILYSNFCYRLTFQWHFTAWKIFILLPKTLPFVNQNFFCSINNDCKKQQVQSLPENRGSSAKPRAYSPVLQPVKLARILLFPTKQKEDNINDYLEF